MKVLIRGYDIYPNEKFETRISGITLFTENTIKDIRYLIKRDNSENIEFSFIRSVKRSYQEHPRYLDNIEIYDLDTTDTFSIYGKYKNHIKQVFRTDSITVKDAMHPLLKPRIERVAQVYNKVRPDVIWAVNGMPICEVLHGKILGNIDLDVPVVASISDLFPDVKDLILKYQDLLNYITTPSKQVYNEFKDYIPQEKLVFVDHGIDSLKIRSEISKIDKDNTIIPNIVKILQDQNKKTIIIPARRVPHKGHLYAIKAFKDVLKTQDCYLIITGNEHHNPEYHRQIESEIKNLELESRVMLTEEISSEEAWWLIENSDVSLIPSYYEEGFCYANIEAMLLGTLVVTSNIGAPLQYIKEGVNGFFVKTQDVDSIKKILNKVLSLSKIEREEIKQNALNTAMTYQSVEKSKVFLDLFYKLKRTFQTENVEAFQKINSEG